MKLERIGWAVLAGALLTLFLLEKCNNKPCPAITTGIDTGYLNTTDTLIDDTIKPVRSAKRKFYVKSPVNSIQPVNIIEDSIPTNGIKEEDYAIACPDTNFYQQTYKVPYGSLTVSDTVTENKITGRSIAPVFSIPVITKTDTIHKTRTVIALSRFQLYAGADIIANRLLYGAGFSLAAKTKKEKLYTAGAIYTNYGWLYQAGFKTKISFNLFNRKK